MSISANEYELLRAWLAHFVAKYLPFIANTPPESHPIAVLDSIAAKSRANARKGLAMAINDMVEMTDRLSPPEVQTADADFERNGLPTLSAIRARFWKPIRLALKRGHIQGEVEYYAVRNAAEMTTVDEERTRLWALIEKFEERAGQ